MSKNETDIYDDNKRTAKDIWASFPLHIKGGLYTVLSSADFTPVSDMFTEGMFCDIEFMLFTERGKPVFIKYDRRTFAYIEREIRVKLLEMYEMELEAVDEVLVDASTDIETETGKVAS